MISVSSVVDQQVFSSRSAVTERDHRPRIRSCSAQLISIQTAVDEPSMIEIHIGIKLRETNSLPGHIFLVARSRR
jgi:hypothetical protein